MTAHLDTLHSAWMSIVSQHTLTFSKLNLQNQNSALHWSLDSAVYIVQDAEIIQAVKELNDDPKKHCCTRCKAAFHACSCESQQFNRPLHLLHHSHTCMKLYAAFKIAMAVCGIVCNEYMCYRGIIGTNMNTNVILTVVHLLLNGLRHVRLTGFYLALSMCCFRYNVHAQSTDLALGPIWIDKY